MPYRLLMLTVAVAAVSPSVSAATTDRFLTGWWHHFELASGIGDQAINYRAPTGTTSNRSKMFGEFERSLSLTYSLQQHDMVRPGYYAGAYWGVGASLVQQSMSEDLPSGELTYDNLLIIPRLQVGLSFRWGRRFMVQAGPFAGFGMSIGEISARSGGTTTNHLAVAYEHGLEIKARYSFTERLFASLGFSHNHREAAHSRGTYFLGGSFGAVQLNTDIDQDTYNLTVGVGMKF